MTSFALQNCHLHCVLNLFNQLIKDGNQKGYCEKPLKTQITLKASEDVLTLDIIIKTQIDAYGSKSPLCHEWIENITSQLDQENMSHFSMN